MLRTCHRPNDVSFPKFLWWSFTPKYGWTWSWALYSDLEGTQSKPPPTSTYCLKNSELRKCSLTANQTLLLRNFEYKNPSLSLTSPICGMLLAKTSGRPDRQSRGCRYSYSRVHAMGRTDKERSGVARLHEGSFRCVGRWLQSPPQTAMLQAMASAWWTNAEKGQSAWNPRTWVQLSHFRVQSFEAFISKTGLTLLCLYMVAIHINPDETAQAKLRKRAWMAATILKVPLVVVTVIGCSRFVALRVLTLALPSQFCRASPFT